MISVITGVSASQRWAGDGSRAAATGGSAGGGGNKPDRRGVAARSDQAAGTLEEARLEEVCLGDLPHGVLRPPETHPRPRSRSTA